LNEQKQAFFFSIGIHFVACILAFGVIQGAAPERRPLIIDFSLIDQSAAAQAPSAFCEPMEPKPLPANVDEEIAPVGPQIQQMVTENQVPIAAPEPKPVEQKAPKRLNVRKKISPEKQVRREIPPAPSNTGPNTEESTAGSNAGVPVAEPSGSVGSKERPEMRYMKAHLARIRDAIIRKLSYPPLARSKGWTGTVRVSFVINEDGSVKNVKVLAGSGFEVLDSNVVETIKYCSPFPKPPCIVEMIMPITYRLYE